MSRIKRPSRLPTPPAAPIFSAPQSCPTLFESALLAEAEPDTAWVRIGQRIGVSNLAFILDELGGGHTYVPARGNFFPALHQKAARREILRRAGQGKSCATLAAEVGVSKSQAHKFRRTLGTARKRKP